jgi:catechol 2,3-dioxygenase-like lactoylglutathione lyase family enzyme
VSDAQTPKAGKVEVAVVARDLDASIHFYADTLGLPYVGDMQLPNGLMKRYLYGDTIIKIIGFETPPELSGPGGMMAGVTGFRYVTFAVDDVAGMQKRFEDAGYEVAVPAFEFRPGLFIAIVEDPDGNWVEFVPAAAGA